MALNYTLSTEKVARSYQRTAQMVPNPGVSALTVVNGSVKIEPSMDAAATLSSPLAGTHLRRNSMAYSVHTRRSRGGMKIRINRRRRSRRLHSNVNYALVSNRRRSRRRLSRNVNYALVSNRRRSRRIRSNRRHSRRLHSNRRRSRRLHSNRRHSRRRGGR
jgi:hypothetical protein